MVGWISLSLVIPVIAAILTNCAEVGRRNQIFRIIDFCPTLIFPYNSDNKVSDGGKNEKRMHWLSRCARSIVFSGIGSSVIFWS
ncbi:hypothetical protein C6A28_01870 [Streptococcus anginosus]|nr:hypothetical protein C6A29_01445 [Streptococcus anginosus]PRT71936.1 hypothetical protein C6A28_01870 [Streptococcus anginosus]